jgi:hypothetical protein
MLLEATKSPTFATSLSWQTKIHDSPKTLLDLAAVDLRVAVDLVVDDAVGREPLVRHGGH